METLHHHSLASDALSTHSQPFLTDSLFPTSLHQILSSLVSYADDNLVQLERLSPSLDSHQKDSTISPTGVNVGDVINFEQKSIRSAKHHARHPAKARSTSTRTLQSEIPSTPNHNLVFHGGKTIPDLSYVNFYLGGQSAWKPSDVQSINYSLAAAMFDPGLNSILAQYFPNQTVTSQFLGSTVLPNPAPALTSEATIKSLLTTLDQSGALKGYDLSTTAFNFLLPSGTVLTDGQDNSSDGLSAYHGSVHVTVNGHTDTIYYAVGVYPQQYSDGNSNGIPIFSQPWQNVVSEFYHELNEIRTDPDVEDAINANNNNLLGWMSPQGDEIGDFPVTEAFKLGLPQFVFRQVPLANGSGTVPVQLLYSNAVSGIQLPSSLAA